MKFHMKRFLLAAICIPSLLAQDPAAEGYEAPGPISSAELVPASVLSRPLWKIAPLAQTDGLRATYQLSSSRGVELVSGTQSLLLRTRELEAILALDRLNKSEEFGRALVKSGADKVESVKEAVKDPAGTIQRLPEGAGRLLGRVATAVKNTAEGKGNPRTGIEAALGVSRKKAELALQLGVSPYTRDPVLQEKLDATARAAAGGALVVNLSGLLVGGGVGTAISVVNVNQTLQNTLIESSPEEMQTQNRATLTALGASSKEVGNFLANSFFTPWQKSIVTSHLKAIGANPGAFLQLAAQASTPEDALSFEQEAALLQNHSESAAAISSLQLKDGFLIARDAKGILATPVAADWLSWTPALAARCEALRAAADADSEVPALALITDGLLSAQAREALADRSIQVTEQSLRADR